MKQIVITLMVTMALTVSTIQAVEPTDPAVIFDTDFALPSMPAGDGSGTPVCVDDISGLLVAGCDGAVGPQGPAGPQGEPGTAVDVCDLENRIYTALPSFERSEECISGPTVHCGTIDTDEIWSPTAEGHLISCNVYVQADLFIGPGTVIRFQPGTSIFIGQTSAASLTVAGNSSGNSVTLTSTSTTPVEGDWGSLVIGPFGDALIEGAEFYYCGQTDACLVVNGASLTELRDSIISYSSSRGIHVSGEALISVQSTTISYNVLHGIEIVAPAGLASNPIRADFAFNAVNFNGGFPVVLPASEVDELHASSTYSGNSEDNVLVKGATIEQDADWETLDAAYRIQGEILVAGAASPILTIESGAALFFDPDAGLLVGFGLPGSLSAIGESGSPILFSAYPEPPVSWDGIQFLYDCVSSTLDNIIVEYGGGLGNIVWQGCPLGTISNSRVSDSPGWGIYRVGSADPTITNVTYENNALGDLY